MSHVPSNAEISEGLADYNKPKNRDQDCIPCVLALHTDVHSVKRSSPVVALYCRCHFASHAVSQVHVSKSYCSSFTVQYSLYGLYIVVFLVTCCLPVSCADNLGRPRLLGVGFHTGADFINGSLVDVSTAMVSNSVSFQCISVAPLIPQGYKTRNYFIVTQGPLANTINDFWLMVWQNKSACIVMLCDTMEEDKVCLL